MACGGMFPWSVLREGDGRCGACLCSGAAGNSSLDGVLASSESVGAVPASPAEASSGSTEIDLEVECSICGVLAPWSLLASGDGCCPLCFKSAVQAAVGSHASSSEGPAEAYAACGGGGASGVRDDRVSDMSAAHSPSSSPAACITGGAASSVRWKRHQKPLISAEA